MSPQRAAGQSPPPENQSDAQIGDIAHGRINSQKGSSPSSDQNKGAQGAKTLKDCGKEQQQAGGNEGTKGLESNPKEKLKDWSDNIAKKPGDWKAPGGDVDA